jgi:uncharacterized protein (DUF1015 family)
MQILPQPHGQRSGRPIASRSVRARENVGVVDGSPTPRRKGEVAMYLAGRWYAVDLSGLRPEDDSRASGLDVALLQRQVLEPQLGIGDIRTDKRIDFVGGARGTEGLERAVDSGAAAVALDVSCHY